MTIKQSAIAHAILLFTLAGSAVAPAQAQPVAAHAVKARHAVVFQISDDDPARWELAMSNIRNVQADLGRDNVTVELVVYGPGLALLRLESPAGNRIADALGAGVKVVACENTMLGQKLTKDDMLPGISYVKAGVSEIMFLQEAGYAYIRP